MAAPAPAPAAPEAGAATPILRLEGLVKHFGAVKAVDGISLSISKPEIFSLLGASGSGKTTMLRILAGFEQPDAGSIYLDGEDITAWPAYKRPINMMFQSYALFPHLSVFDNIAYGLRRRTPWWARGGGERRAIRDAVTGLADMLELGALTGRRIHQLSGGQRQRVALARALSLEPRLLLLDEPLSALDRKLRETTQLELVRLQYRLGLSFIIVTHDQEEAMALSDRLAVMRDGRIVQVGSPQAVYAQPQDRHLADFLGTVSQFPVLLGQRRAEGLHATCRRTGTRFLVPPETLPAATDGDPATLALRPERVRILGEGARPEAPNQVIGSVQDMAFLGDHWRVSVEIETKDHDPAPFILRVSAFSGDDDRPPAHYDRPVTLAWRPEAVLAYPGEGPR